MQGEASLLLFLLLNERKGMEDYEEYRNNNNSTIIKME